jgi:hypothetical protein
MRVGGTLWLPPPTREREQPACEVVWRSLCYCDGVCVLWCSVVATVSGRVGWSPLCGSSVGWARGGFAALWQQCGVFAALWQQRGVGAWGFAALWQQCGWARGVFAALWQQCGVGAWGVRRFVAAYGVRRFAAAVWGGGGRVGGSQLCFRSVGVWGRSPCCCGYPVRGSVHRFVAAVGRGVGAWAVAWAVGVRCGVVAIPAAGGGRARNVSLFVAIPT